MAKAKEFTLEDVKGMVDKSTGRVMMIVDVPFAPYDRGSLASFTPEYALQHYNNGFARFQDFPNDMKVEFANKGEDPRNNPPAAAVTSKDVKPPFKLPDDWKERDAIQKRYYLSQILGKPAKDLGTDEEIAAALEKHAAKKG